MNAWKTLVPALALALPACYGSSGGPNATFTFAKSYGGEANDSANAAIPTADGGYLFAGVTNGRVGVGDYADGDLWLTKLDALGNVSWQTSYGERLANPTALDIDFVSVREAPGGALWLGGIEGRSQELYGGYREDRRDIAITKVDRSGQPLWPAPIIYDSGGFPNYPYFERDGATAEDLHDMWPTADGGLLVVSWLTANVETFSNEVGRQGGEAHAVQVLKIDSSGRVDWQRFLYEDEAGRQPLAYFPGSLKPRPLLLIRETPDGGAIISASAYEGRFDRHLRVTRLLPGGDLLWIRDFDEHYAVDVIQVDDDFDAVSDDGFLLCGEAETYLGPVPLNDDNGMVMKLDADGRVQWTHKSSDIFMYNSVAERRLIPGTSQHTYIAVGRDATTTFERDGTVIAEMEAGGFRVRYRIDIDMFEVLDDAGVTRYSSSLALSQTFSAADTDGCSDRPALASFTQSNDVIIPCGLLVGPLTGVAIQTVEGAALGFVALGKGSTPVELAYDVLETVSSSTGAVDGYTVAGRASSFLEDGRPGVWILRVGLDGRIRWQRFLENLDTWKGYYGSMFTSTPDGGYLVGGLGGAPALTPQVVKLTSEGDVQWTSTSIARGQRTGRSFEGDMTALGVNEAGECVAVGNDGLYVWVACLDQTGQSMWYQQVYSSSFVGSSMAVGPDGYVVAGYRESGDLYTFKLGRDGQLMWSYSYPLGELEVEGSATIGLTSDGGYAVAATVRSAEHSGATGKLNYALFKFDEDGAPRWYRVFGGLEDEYVRDLQVLDDGGFLLSGLSRSMGEFGEAWILRLGPDGFVAGGTCQTYLGGGVLEASTVWSSASEAYVPQPGLIGAQIVGLDTNVVQWTPENIAIARQCSGTATNLFDDPPPDIETFTLTVRSGGVGTGTVNSVPDGIVCGPICSAAFEAGTQVYLLAEPDFPYAVRWVGCDEVVGAEGCLVAMDRDRLVEVFYDNPFSTLTVEFAGGGSGRVVSSPLGVDCTANCEAHFPAGTAVFLTPVADEGSVFSHWSNCDPDGDFGVEGCVVTLVGNRTVVAHFESSGSR